MKKLIVVICLMSLLAMQGTACAMGKQEGDLILTDMAYGAAIGGLLGLSIFLLDQDHFTNKIGSGVALGMIGGFAYGMVEVKGLVQIEHGRTTVAMPQIHFTPTTVKTTLLSVKY